MQIKTLMQADIPEGRTSTFFFFFQETTQHRLVKNVDCEVRRTWLKFLASSLSSILVQFNHSEGIFSSFSPGIKRGK